MSARRWTDSERAARYVVEHYPKAFPNGHLVDELVEQFRQVRRDERGGMGLAYAEMKQACRNVGVDLDCGACAAVFYTGLAMVGDEHTCKPPMQAAQPSAMLTAGRNVVCPLPRTEGG